MEKPVFILANSSQKHQIQINHLAKKKQNKKRRKNKKL